ncbi:hypothetical protein cyc_07736 [Cyclospora cayetanensis]|uniref:Uncharacterized protein n=1 Tax=Cyclospora cayetanensis TaxID=88456 RepID=A0A1D3CZP1_9EIME|nr:hypothetical protein cyc_07736 [Cyclospora cayetanensis]
MVPQMGWRLVGEGGQHFVFANSSCPGVVVKFRKVNCSCRWLLTAQVYVHLQRLQQRWLQQTSSHRAAGSEMRAHLPVKGCITPLSHSPCSMPHETAAIYGKKGSKGVLHGSIHRAKGIQGSTVGFFKTTDRLRNRRKTFSSGFAADRGAVGPLMQIQRDTLWRQPTLFAKLRSLESTKRRSPTRLIRLEVSRHLDGNNSTGRWIRRSGVKAEVCASRESFAPQAQTKLAFPPPTLARLGINPAKSTRLAAVRSVPSGGARSLAGDVRQTPTFFGLPLENVELQRVGSAPVEVLQQFSSLAGSVAGILTGRASQDTCTTPQAACAVSLQPSGTACIARRALDCHALVFSAVFSSRAHPQPLQQERRRKPPP